jgi:hypothetical protein
MTDQPYLKGAWEVGGIRRAQAFFDALVDLLPLPSYFRFEGTSIAPDVRKLLEANAVVSAMQIPAGTLLPKPSVFHVLANEAFSRKLAGLASQYAEPEICDHFHAYQDGRVLLQWYDAFLDPLLVDQTIPEVAVQRFCSKLGVRYSQRHSF